MAAKPEGQEEEIPIQDRVSYAYLTLKELRALVRDAGCEAFEQALQTAQREAASALSSLARGRS